MSRLEELQKAFDDALEELQKASDAWYNYDVDWATYDTARTAFCKTRRELIAYKRSMDYE